MSRFYLNKQWLHKVYPESLFEKQFEDLIVLQAPDLYPDFYVIPFKMTLSSPFGKSKPDLIFIARDYNDWYVVEVEMAHHSYSSHVEPQIRNLAYADYGEDVINYLLRSSKELDPDQTKNLILYEPAKLLMILNSPRPDWEKDLKNKYGLLTSVFEVFQIRKPGERLELPNSAFVINGSYPVYSVYTSTECTVHPYLPYLEIVDNSDLRIKPNDEIILEYEDCLTSWKAIQGPEKSIWITTSGRNAIIDKNRDYRITKLRDNSLFLDVIHSRK